MLDGWIHRCTEEFDGGQRPICGSSLPDQSVIVVLDEFLDLVPAGIWSAFEFRSTSWHSDDVFDQLRARNLALCIADSEKLTTPVVATADYGYLRLRDEGYREADFAKWAEIIRRHEDVWGDTFVYFKHEEEGKGPEFARALEKSLRATPSLTLPCRGRG
ncbi:MAG: DUF72 domain-containing protein [Chloroflexi bacterium]|nr:DUF72 domain-containing protein [Chloroflexota bacterium]